MLPLNRLFGGSPGWQGVEGGGTEEPVVPRSRRLTRGLPLRGAAYANQTCGREERNRESCSDGVCLSDGGQSGGGFPGSTFRPEAGSPAKAATERLSDEAHCRYIDGQ